jgi:hypothetical protein
MKAQILKIAGVKTEAEFYKKFPSEEAFMKKHGKELEKAQNGIKKKFTTPKMTFQSVSGSSSPVQDYYINSNEDASLLTTSYELGKSSNLTTGETTTIKPLTNAQLAGNMLLNQAGTLVGLGQTIADKYGRQTDELNNYEKFSKMIAGMPAPAMVKPKYVRPEYSQVSDPQKYGIPMAQDGASVGGNPTEIQNTYDPYDIYAGLAYEPLNDSNPKKYFAGGPIANSPVAAAGGGVAGGFDASKFMGAAGSLGGALGSLSAGDDFAQTEEGQLLSTLGGTLGTAFGGPVVGALASAGLGYIGGKLGGDKNKEMKSQRNSMNANMYAGAYTNTLQNGPLNSYAEDGTSIPSYEEGGYMNPEYNPQVIAKFGDYSMDQLLAPPHDADMLRAGGHLKEYTPPSAAAMYTGRDLPYQMEDGGQMAMGGELQVHKGKAETMSYNPFLPNNGETVMFRGPSHDNGGMPISYGQNGVEVEGGEPAQIMQDGGETDGNLVVFGNMVIPEYGVAELGDSKAKGKKFKHYIADLSKVEAKQNKLLEKTTSLIDDSDALDQFDKLSLNTGQANLIGATMKLKDIAEKKKTAAAVQNAILDTASEMGLESDALAKGKIKYAKANDPYAEFGAKLETAQLGKSVSPKQLWQIPKKERAALAKANGIKNYTGTKSQNIKLMGIINKPAPQPLASKFLSTPIDPVQPLQYPIGEQQPQPTMLPEWMSADVTTPIDMSNYVAKQKEVDTDGAAAPADNSKKKKDKSSAWDNVLTGINSLIPYLRPSNQMNLDPSQLSGEMLALATNQLEPVYAQSYQPNLAQPYAISLQDMRNQITSEARNAYRLAQGNPAAAAMIGAQSAEGKNKINAEEFRANQGEQARVAELNRQTLNDAQMKNLAIFQDQAGKMSQARSNTKQQSMVALNSINDKIAKNKLENRTLGITENLYNYRFSPNGVAYNVNPLAQFAPYGSGASSKGAAGQLKPGKKFSFDENQQIIGTYNVDKDETVAAKNGKKISKGDQKNSSIVKAIKNL